MNQTNDTPAHELAARNLGRYIADLGHFVNDGMGTYNLKDPVDVVDFVCAAPLMAKSRPATVNEAVRLAGVIASVAERYADERNGPTTDAEVISWAIISLAKKHGFVLGETIDTEIDNVFEETGFVYGGNPGRVEMRTAEDDFAWHCAFADPLGDEEKPLEVDPLVSFDSVRTWEAACKVFGEESNGELFAGYGVWSEHTKRCIGVYHPSSMNWAIAKSTAKPGRHLFSIFITREAFESARDDFFRNGA